MPAISATSGWTTRMSKFIGSAPGQGGAAAFAVIAGRRYRRARRISSAQRSRIGRISSALGRGQADDDAGHAAIAPAPQPVRFLGGAEHRHRQRIADPGRPRPPSAGTAAGTRSRPGIAAGSHAESSRRRSGSRAARHAGRRRRPGPAGRASAPASARSSSARNRPARRGIRPRLSVQISFIASTRSRISLKRVLNAVPWSAISSAFQPPPTPNRNRPPETWSIEATSFAVWIGSRWATRHTPVPSFSARRHRGRRGQRHERVHHLIIFLRQLAALRERRLARDRDVRMLRRPNRFEAARLEPRARIRPAAIE